jgi:hypothetical protein
MITNNCNIASNLCLVSRDCKGTLCVGIIYLYAIKAIIHTFFLEFDVLMLLLFE